MQKIINLSYTKNDGDIENQFDMIHSMMLKF